MLDSDTVSKLALIKRNMFPGTDPSLMILTNCVMTRMDWGLNLGERECEAVKHCVQLHTYYYLLLQSLAHNLALTLEKTFLCTMGVFRFGARL